MINIFIGAFVLLSSVAGVDSEESGDFILDIAKAENVHRTILDGRPLPNEYLLVPKGPYGSIPDQISPEEAAPVQPLPNSLFVYSPEEAILPPTPPQQVSATYRFRPSTPSYKNLVRSDHMDDYAKNVDYQVQSVPQSFVRLQSDVLNCFSRFRNCLLVNVATLERIRYVSVEQCLKRCLKFSTELGVRCAGVLYSSYSQSCDLHGTIGSTFPARRLLMYGFDFYENCDTCNSNAVAAFSTTVTPPLITVTNPLITTASPSITANGAQETLADKEVLPNPSTLASLGEDFSCPPDTTPMYFRTTDAKLGSIGTAISVMVPDERGCRQVCSENSHCRFYEYDLSLHLCKITSDLSQGIGASDEFVTGEKVCVAADLTNQCPSATIDKLAKSFFIGKSLTVQRVDSPTRCVELCLDALKLFQFKCLSVSYFPTERALNCLLSDQSRKTMPSFVQMENQTNVDYYGLDDCNEPSSFNAQDIDADFRLLSLQNDAELSQPAESEFIPQADVSPQEDESQTANLEGQWSQWSECGEFINGRRLRFKNCVQASLELCPIEEENCIHEETSQRNPAELRQLYETFYAKVAKQFSPRNPLIRRLRRNRIQSIACWTKRARCYHQPYH